MVLRLLLLALVLFGGALVYATRVYTELPVDPAWQVSADADLPPGAVTVRFTGTSTLLFSDGETRWLVDGWFSRFGPLRLALGKIAPDSAAIDRGLSANGITTLDAVFGVMSPGNTYQLELIMTATTIAVEVDTVQEMSVVDASISAAGRAGVRSGTVNDKDTGKHIDNFFAVDGSSPSPTATAQAVWIGL